MLQDELAYCLGLAHGLRGDEPKTLGVIADLEARAPTSLPTWLLQAWALWKADLLFLLGRTGEAHDVARLAARSFGPTPLSLSFTGAFDRWMSVTLQDGPSLESLSALISEHQARVGEFDALDQVEIHFAAAIVAARTRKDPSTHLERGFCLIRCLPRGIETLLSRLSIMPGLNDGASKSLLAEHRLRAAREI